MRQKRYARPFLDYDTLEDKIYLAVNVASNGFGSLAVNGVPNGQVQVTSEGNGQFLVTDNGVDVARVTGITQNIVVDLTLADLDDSVRITLLDEQINNVVVELGEGDNDFQITGNAQISRVIYRGGSGQDTAFTSVDTERITAFFGFDGDNQLTAENNSGRFRYRGGADADTVTLGSSLNAGAFQAEFAGAVLGDGDNNFTSFATITENQFVRGGDGVDRISSYAVGGTASFPMGNGDNTLYIARDHGRLFVRGGYDADAVVFDPNSSVAQKVGIVLWGGRDSVRLDGQITTDVYFNATDGDDLFYINNTALVTGDVTVLFGGGLNRFTSFGEIRGDLFVTSYNVADTYSVAGTVLGQIILRPGRQR